MSHTPRLKLPYILPSQAQKEVTHNKALEILDVLLHPSVIKVGKNIPPTEPKLGDCYAIGSNPQGVWKNHPKTLAHYTNGWNFIEIFVGLTVWSQSTKDLSVYDGQQWLSSSKTLGGYGYYIGEEEVQTTYKEEEKQ